MTVDTLTDEPTHYEILSRLGDRVAADWAHVQDAKAAHDLVLDIHEKARLGGAMTDQVDAAARAVSNAQTRAIVQWTATCREVHDYVIGHDLDGPAIDALSRQYEATDEEATNFGNPIFSAMNVASGRSVWSATYSYDDE